MASVYRKNGRWYTKFKDVAGRWRDKALPPNIRKAEAQRLAHELDGDVAAIGKIEGGGALLATVAELMEWWLTHESPRTASHQRNGSYVRHHFLDDDFGAVRLSDLTAPVIERYLRRKEQDLSPATVNHLRMYLNRALRSAARAAVYRGPNPVVDVVKRRVPERKPEYLRHGEVPLVLAALSDEARPLFATAIYTGMRKGELLGLRKVDVDLDARLIRVRRSHDRDTTKSGKEGVIPIASELIPFLESAIRASPSQYVFPSHAGGRMRADAALEVKLRRAMARAGIVEEWLHVCPRKNCGHSERVADSTLRNCPVCSMKLWPKPEVRRVRFHDLRHTTASLLLMGGADIVAVSRILRHGDPKITMQVYGHLAPGYLRDQVDRLIFFA